MLAVKSFKNGITVEELKGIVAGWPSTAADGTPCEVWVEHNGITNQVKSVWPLDICVGNNIEESADLLLSSEPDE